MTNVRCVTVFCIDMKGLSQHSVQLKNRSDFDIEMLRDCGFVRKQRAFSSSSIIIRSKSVGQLLTQLRQIVFILVLLLFQHLKHLTIP